MFLLKILNQILTIWLTTEIISSKCSSINYSSSKLNFEQNRDTNLSAETVQQQRNVKARNFDDFTSNAYSNKASNLNENGEYKFNVRCPRPEDIHPCTCQEFNKAMDSEYQEMDENFDQDSDDQALLEQATASISSTNDTIVIEDKITFRTSTSKRKTRSQPEQTKQPHPDTIETLVFCKYISHEQVLIDALKGFNGHRVDHFIIDSCILPGFPNKLFANIHILWMQILNTTIHFEEQFFQCAKDCL